jgi:hypothetical protein
MEIAIVPRFIIDRLVSDEEGRAALNALLSSALVLVFIRLTGSFPASTGKLPHTCLFRRLFGIPCPGCGVTASLQAASRLDFRASVRHNPAGLPILAFFLAQVPLRALALADRGMGGPVALLSRRLSGCVTACLLLAWVVRLRGRGAGERGE